MYVNFHAVADTERALDNLPALKLAMCSSYKNGLRYRPSVSEPNFRKMFFCSVWRSYRMGTYVPLGSNSMKPDYLLEFGTLTLQITRPPKVGGGFELNTPMILGGWVFAADVTRGVAIPPR